MALKSELGLVGFGEAGQAFARGWALPAGEMAAYDLKLVEGPERAQMISACAELGVVPVTTPAALLERATTVFSLVPTDQAVAVARAAAPHLRTGTFWLDGSSSAPGTKRAAAASIEAAGGHYVDMAIMAPVHPRRHRTPVLLAGPEATQALAAITALGMDGQVAGPAVGDASAVKMIRSVLVKGLEALTAECLLAARRAGVEEAVLASFAQSDPEIDWAARTAYNLGRMLEHGTRRAAEMREVVATLTELGLPSRLSAATALWQDEMGALDLDVGPGALPGLLDAVLAARR